MPIHTKNRKKDKMKYSALLCLASFIASVCLVHGFCPPDKPGICPKPTLRGICLQGCVNDSSCQGIKKCCSNGCSKTCQTPIREY